MNNHMLGPWVVEDSPHTRGLFFGLAVIRDSLGVIVCHIVEPLNRLWGEAQARARLIAAAPKLLAACKLLVKRLQGPTAIQAFEAIGNGGMLPALYAEVVAAIKDAEQEGGCENGNENDASGT